MKRRVPKDTNKYTLVHKGVILKELSTIESNELMTGSIINVIISGGREYNYDSISSSSSDSDIPQHNLPDLSILPVITRHDYSTIPKSYLLARMTQNELAKVENFTIQNSHGKVIFDGDTDVRHLDLDQIVFIEKQSVNYIYIYI